jgi:hypothetical protein
MSDAPETIWFTKVRHNIVLNSTRVTLDNTEYRRDDLPATQAQIMADPRVKALVEASSSLIAGVRRRYPNEELRCT